jgi:hypothetical protein
MSGVDEVRVGRALLWNFDTNQHRIADPDLLNRVKELIAMYRERGRDPLRGAAIHDVGVVAVGSEDFRRLGEKEFQEVQELRYILFLCCLASNTRLGHNGAHMMVTAENFDVIRQNFVLDSDYLAEQTGVLISMTVMGYRIRETRFIRPAYVNRPTRFRYDERLLSQLKLLRSVNRQLYRRLTRAAAVFLESYYNSPRVDVRARVVLQVAAFEILLDLPEQQPRKAFKDAVERLLSDSGERRYRYKFQMGDRKVWESRTIKGIWADRLYTLRNHIAHGETIPQREYEFRGRQHHLVISPLMFVSCTKRLLEAALESSSKCRPFFERIVWGQIRPADEYDEELRGFQIQEDFARRFAGTR